jgi:hypothetical protein
MLYNSVFRITPPFYIPLGRIIPSLGVSFFTQRGSTQPKYYKSGNLCSLLERPWCKMLCFVIYSLPYIFIYYSCTNVLLQKNANFWPSKII